MTHQDYSRLYYAVSRDGLHWTELNQGKRVYDDYRGRPDICKGHDGRYYLVGNRNDSAPDINFWVTGKTIRIASSASLLGPCSEPSPPVSPNFREAPTLIPSPDGKVWYLYYEQYPGVSYGLSVAGDLKGPWYQISGYTFFSDWDKYSLPAKVRHGCMIPITRSEYDALVERYKWDRDRDARLRSITPQGQAGRP